MNVAEASIGQYFLLGSGDGFVYEKFGDNGTPENPKPVVYKYNWFDVFQAGFVVDPMVEIHPVTVSLEGPSLDTEILKDLNDGTFFIRDTEPDTYYQFFMAHNPPAAGALKFDRRTTQFVDFVFLEEKERVRALDTRFILATKEN